jgi:hypothetical protein
VAVYVDPLFTMESRNAQAFRVGTRTGHRWCHMFADTPEELHALAERIGMRRAWADDHDGDGGHYDLTPPKRVAAIRAGAIPVETAIAVAIWRVHRAFLIVRNCKAGKHTALCPAARECEFAEPFEVLARFEGAPPKRAVWRPKP